MAKKSMMKDMTCTECGVCGTFHWLLPIVIVVLAAVPAWYASDWARWTIIVLAVLLVLKKWCPCPCHHQH
jgi:hypothetical protein